MRKYFIWAIIILVVIFGGTFGINALRNKILGVVFSSRVLIPVISTQPVQSTVYQPTITSVGSLVAINGIDVTPQVSGQIEKILFQSGVSVEKGDPLVQLDDSIDQQTLNNDQAQLNVAKLNYDRNVELLKTQAVAKSAVDSARASYEQAKAAVTADKVAISYKQVKAPFAGKLGIRQVDVGQYISPSVPIVSLQSLDPLYVDFSIPEQKINDIHTGQTINISSDAFPGQVFTGKLTSINSAIDTSTMSVNVRATIDNPNHILIPGQFVNVSVLLDQKTNVLIVPQTAIAYTLYGDSVYVAKPIEKTEAVAETKGKLASMIEKRQQKSATASDNTPATHTVEQQFVTLGDTMGDNIIVTKGLSEKQDVVISGQLKIKNGDNVKINNTVKLD